MDTRSAESSELENSSKVIAEQTAVVISAKVSAPESLAAGPFAVIDQVVSFDQPEQQRQENSDWEDQNDVFDEIPGCQKPMLQVPVLILVR